MAFKITYGGRARPTYSTGTTYTTGSAGTVWEQGDILTLDATANTLLKAIDTNTGIVGLAMEYRREVTGDDNSSDQTSVQRKGAMVVDTAVIDTDRVESGITFAINERLYVGTNGKLTNVAGSLLVGVCLSELDSDSAITALWSPQYVS